MTASEFWFERAITLTAERDRLREVNAKLLAALKLAQDNIERIVSAFTPSLKRSLADQVTTRIAAAIARAEGR